MSQRHNKEQFGFCRQRVLAYLIKLHQAIDADTVDLAEALTARFCDSLVDYLSAGHFQVFQRFVPAPHEYAAIESTTRAAMSFNDRFGNVQTPRGLDLEELRAALESLALIIDTRMELEDDLIEQASVAVA